MEKNLIEELFLKDRKRTPQEARQLSLLVLAFLGDAVFEIFARTRVLEERKSVNQLHRASAQIVKASSQAKLIKELKDTLTEEESDIFRRGRNTKSHTTAKNATIHDYRHSTGFEAVIGYLYITNQIGRLKEIFEEIERILDHEG